MLYISFINFDFLFFVRLLVLYLFVSSSARYAFYLVVANLTGMYGYGVLLLEYIDLTCVSSSVSSHAVIVNFFRR